jgi:hypothetical protein
MGHGSRFVNVSREALRRMADAARQKDSALKRAALLGGGKPPRLERPGTPCKEAEQQQPAHGSVCPSDGEAGTEAPRGSAPAVARRAIAFRRVTAVRSAGATRARGSRASRAGARRVDLRGLPGVRLLDEPQRDDAGDGGARRGQHAIQLGSGHVRRLPSRHHHDHVCPADEVRAVQSRDRGRWAGGRHRR